MKWRALFCGTLIVAMLLTTLMAANQSTNRKQYNTIESYMDPNADPCIDFYQYSCGNWETVHTSTYYQDTFDYVDYQINEEYAHILKTRKKSAHRQHHFVRQVLSFYKSCMSVEEFSLIPYIDWMIKHENITWPDDAENERSESFDWLYMLATLRRYGLNDVFLSESLLQQRDDSRHFLIDIDKPVNDDEFEPLTYRQFELIMEYLGIDKRRKQRKLWKGFENFESKILELYQIEDDEGFEELKLKQVNIPQLERYLKIIFDVEYLNPNMYITISNRPYIRALFTFLENYSDKFICRYLIIRYLWHLNYNGPSGFEKVDCISNMRAQMPLAMVWLHEQQNPTLVEEAEHVKWIFENIRTHFLKTLNKNQNSFDAEVLGYLNRKLKGMQFKVGNLPRNATVATLEQFYHELELTESDFYANHLKLLRFNTRKQHERLNTTLSLDAMNFYHLEDTSFDATSTPYFLQRSNMVIMPLTLLHLPMYHPRLHDIFKYSLIGFLLAHEITHGFDESGLDYDEYGNIQLTSERIKTNRMFDNNFDCLYAKNPKVIDEKIADVSGLRLAFEAYFSNGTHATTISSWSKIPETQFFFRNFALFFCGSSSNDKKLANSSHGTWRSRLQDTVSQFPVFGQVYGCAVGSPMNPARKCQLWR